MAVNIADLIVHIGADVKDLKAGMQEAEGVVSKAGSAMGTAAKIGMAALVTGGGAVVAAMGGAVKVAADFESQMNGIKAVSGATGDEMSQLSNKALQIGKDTAFSASEAAGAIEELVKAGVSIPDVLNGAADAAVALAAAGGVSIPEAANLAANAMNQFGLAAKDLPGVVDLIAGAANASAIDVGQFSYSLQAVGAVANLAGLNFKDTATAIAELGNAGIVGSDAGTSLQSMLMNLQPSTKAATEQFKALGIITEDGANRFYDAQGKIKPMSEIAEILRTSLEGLSPAAQQAALQVMFGADGIRAAAVIAKGGAAGFNDLAEQMTKVSAQDVANTRMSGTKGALEQLKGTLETLGIMIGQRILPIVADFLQWLTNGLNDLMPLIDEFGPKIADGLGAAATQIGQWVQAAMPMLKQFGEQVVTAVQTAMPYLQQFGAWFVSTAMPAIGALVAKYVEFEGAVLKKIVPVIVNDVLPGLGRFADWFTKTAAPAIAEFAGKVGTFINDQVIPAIKRVYADVLPSLQKAWDTISREVIPTVKAIAEQIRIVFEAIAGFIQKHGDQIKNILDGAWKVMSTIIGTAIKVIADTIALVMNLIQGDWSGAWDNIKDIVSVVWDAIKKISDVATQALNALINLALDALKALFERIWNGIKSFLEGVWRDIQSTAQTAWDGIKGVLSGLWDGIKGDAERIWNALKSSIDTVWNAIKQGFEDAKTGIKNAVLWPFEQARDAIGGIMEAFKTALAAPWNAAANGINNFIDKMRGAINWVGDKLHLGELIGGDFARIPTFARGGVAPGGLAIVGEEGPELVELPSGARVKTASETAKLLGGMNSDLAGAIFGGNPFAGIGSAVKGVAQDVAGGIRDFVSKGAEAVLSAAFDAVKLGGIGGDGIFGSIGGGIVKMLKDAATEAIKSIVDEVKNALPQPQVAGGAMPGGGSPQFGGTFINPVPGAAFVQGSYGAYSHKNIAAVDLAAGRGTPIIAPAAGRLMFDGQNGWSGGTGHTAMMQHSDEFVSLYGHVSAVLASIGDLIKQGQGFARVGAPEYDGGFGQGAHLHFELFKNGARVRPEDYIAFANGGLITEPIVGTGLRSGRGYIMGEAGPEYVVPAGKAGGALTINLGGVTVNGSPGMDEARLATLVRDEVSDALLDTARALGVAG